MRLAMQRAKEKGKVTDVVMIGDTPRDMQAGEHAGARTIGTATGIFNEEELRRAGADRTIRDFKKTEMVVQMIAGGK